MGTELDLSSISPATSPSGAGGGGSDLEQQIAMQQQKAQLMTAIHKINDVCWDTCIDSAPGSSLSGRQQTCLTNCAERFVDTTLLVTNRFAQLAQRMQQGMR